MLKKVNCERKRIEGKQYSSWVVVPSVHVYRYEFSGDHDITQSSKNIRIFNPALFQSYATV